MIDTVLLNSPPEYLVFPTARLKREWRDYRLHPLLREVTVWVANERFRMWGALTEVRSIWRSDRENETVKARTQVHPDWRGIDTTVCRDRLKWEIDLAIRADGRWPTRMIGMPRIDPRINHGTGPHHHVQVTIPEQREYFREHRIELERKIV